MPPYLHKNFKKSSKNELKSRFGCGNSTLWLHYTMENAAKSKQTQICHQIYPNNTLKRKNHKKVEIAWVVILAADFRFFHIVRCLDPSEQTNFEKSEIWC